MWTTRPWVSRVLVRPTTVPSLAERATRHHSHAPSRSRALGSRRRPAAGGWTRYHRALSRDRGHGRRRVRADCKSTWVALRKKIAAQQGELDESGEGGGGALGGGARYGGGGGDDEDDDEAPERDTRSSRGARDSDGGDGGVGGEDSAEDEAAGDFA